MMLALQLSHFTAATLFAFFFLDRVRHYPAQHPE